MITGATVAFRASCRRLVLPIPTDIPGYIHDRWIATLVAAVAPIDFIDEPLILYRQHSTQCLGAEHSSQFEKLSSRFRNYRGDLANEESSVERVIDTINQRRSRIRESAAQYFARHKAHLEVRRTLPHNRLLRIGPIIRELASGRYHHVSRGWLSAAKDLVL